MPVHHQRTGTLYVLVLVSVITGLVCGSEAVRWVMAGLLLVGAVPLWHMLGREFIAKGITEAARFIRDRDESS